MFVLRYYEAISQLIFYVGIFGLGVSIGIDMGKDIEKEDKLKHAPVEGLKED